MFKFSKVRDVQSPTRANESDAGVDFFIPNDLKQSDLKDFDKDVIIYDNEIVIPAHGRVCIPSGIHVKIQRDHALIATNKSGIAAKEGIIFGAQLIDSAYMGEVHISIINTNPHQIEIPLGKKIIQFVLHKVELDIPEELPFDRLYDEETTRGTGGFGSSGT